MHRSDPPVYRLIDDQKSSIEGTFYEQELYKVSVSKHKLYRECVAAALTREKQVLIKWVEYPDSLNTWLDKISLVEYNTRRSSDNSCNGTFAGCPLRKHTSRRYRKEQQTFDVVWKSMPENGNRLLQ